MLQKSAHNILMHIGIMYLLAYNEQTVTHYNVQINNNKAYRIRHRQDM